MSSEIDRYRIKKINDIQQQIREYNFYIDNLRESNKKITRSQDYQYDQLFVDNLKDKNNKKIVDYERKIEDLEKEISETRIGKRDTEFTSKRNKQKEIPQTANNIPKRELYKEKKYQDNNSKYDIKKADYHFLNAVNSLPEYMANNLKTMPHNKGYIWKGVWFMGLLRGDDRGDRVMFEKKNHTIYEKYGQNNKRMVYQKVIGKNKN